MLPFARIILQVHSISHPILFDILQSGHYSLQSVLFWKSFKVFNHTACRIPASWQLELFVAWCRGTVPCQGSSISQSLLEVQRTIRTCQKSSMKWSLPCRALLLHSRVRAECKNAIGWSKTDTVCRGHEVAEEDYNARMGWRTRLV